MNECDYLYSDASNIASFPYWLKNSRAEPSTKSYLDMIAAVQTVFPYFHDFYLEPRGTDGEEKILLKWLHKFQDTPSSANHLSDGTARFICIATLFLQPFSLRPKTIVLDEPQLGLHPAALEVLGDIIKFTSKTSQVICSTQSVTLANLFEAADFIVVDQFSGKSMSRRVNENEINEWLSEYKMGDVWNKNLIGGRPEW